jgi:EAL domain-containing protein (putative c-di-GMP-specific phosphodiesterase class I)
MSTREAAEPCPEPEAHALLEPQAIAFHHQPVVRLDNARTHAYEALMRPMLDGFGGPLAAFRAAEGAGLASQLDRACLEGAIDALPEVPRGTRLFVNASPTTLLDGTITATGLTRKIRAQGGAPESVVLELTEHAEVTDLEALAHATTSLKRAGVGLALDDAGTGNNSLERISLLRPDYVKLDQSLVQGCDRSFHLLELVRILTTFCVALGATVIAEGIETVRELTAVKRAGAHMAQGFGIARPSRGYPEVDRATASTIVRSTVVNRSIGAASRALSSPLATIDDLLTILAGSPRGQRARRRS